MFVRFYEMVFDIVFEVGLWESGNFLILYMISYSECRWMDEGRNIF